MKTTLVPALFAAATLSAPAAITITLPGNQDTALWTNLDNSQHVPASSTNTPWGPVAADGGSSIGISKTSGPGYLYSGGIYGWHTAPSNYTITGAAPMGNLATVVLQARMNQLPASISLSYNSGSQLLAAVNVWSTPAGSGGFGPISDFGWQWDLSGVVGPIGDFTINIAAPPSTVFYSGNDTTTAAARLRLDQGDTFAAVPEPSSALLSLGALLLANRRRA